MVGYLYPSGILRFSMIKKIFLKLWKAATAYVVASIALIQLASVVLANVSSETSFGYSSETVMQFIFITVLALFPVVLIASYFVKGTSLVQNIEDSQQKTFDPTYRQKLAVIPFENLNEDKEGAFLVDGVVEDLITEFSMIKEIEVASRKTCFSFRNKDYTTEEFKNEWDFDFVVSGSIRAVQERIRISVELSEMESGNVIWSNKYDEVQKDIFEIQDEIVTKIINSMIGKIELSSLQRANRKPTGNMTSYELTLKGRALNQKFEKEANAEAIKAIDAAIEADENNPLPYSWKACTMGQALALGFQEQTDEFMGTFLEALNKGIELNDNDWNANRIMGEVHLTMHDFNQTKVFATKAFNANPNNSAVLSIYADSLIRTEEIDKGIEIIEKAMRLDPKPLGDLNSDRWLNALFFANYLNNDYQRCKDILNEIQEINIKTWLTNLDIAKKQEDEFKDEPWFKRGFEENKSVDWTMEVDRFHLPSEEDKNHLISLASSVYA